MSSSDYHISSLEQYHKFLCEKLDYVKIADYMVEKGGLKDNDANQVKTQGTDRLCRQKLLQYVKEGDKMVYLVFIHALSSKAVGQDYLAQCLQENDEYCADGNYTRATAQRERHPTGNEYPPNPPGSYSPAARRQLACEPQQLDQSSNVQQQNEGVAEAIETDSEKEELVLEDADVLGVDDPKAAYIIYKEAKIFPVYKNFNVTKGLALIITNCNFACDDMTQRQGAEVDKVYVKNLFRNLGYIVKDKDDLTAQCIKNEMAKFANDDRHKDFDSAVVVIMSHGAYGAVYGTDGQEVFIKRLMTYLSASQCPALHEKPKLFFIQACRGKNHDFGTFTGGKKERGMQEEELRRSVLDTPMFDPSPPVLPKSNDQINKDFKDKTRIDSDSCEGEDDEGDGWTMMDGQKKKRRSLRRIPDDGDFLLALATTPGYIALRNKLEGSRFIRKLVKVFGDHAKDAEIQTLLTKVNSEVAEEGGQARIQVSHFQSSLRKHFYFFPGVSVKKTPKKK